MSPEYVKLRAVNLLSARMRKAGRQGMKDEGRVGVAMDPQVRSFGRLLVCGLMGMLGPDGDPSYRRYLESVASGQISANSNRGLVIGGMLAWSRQLSLNRSPAFSSGMASHHARHGLSSLANTRWLMSISSQFLASDWPFASDFAATGLSCFARAEVFADFPVSAVTLLFG